MDLKHDIAEPEGLTELFLYQAEKTNRRKNENENSENTWIYITKYIEHDLVLNSNRLLNKELEGKPPSWQMSA